MMLKSLMGIAKWRWRRKWRAKEKAKAKETAARSSPIGQVVAYKGRASIPLFASTAMCAIIVFGGLSAPKWAPTVGDATNSMRGTGAAVLRGVATHLKPAHEPIPLYIVPQEIYDDGYVEYRLLDRQGLAEHCARI